MAEKAGHHAAGPATGYIFQFGQAMLELLPHALVDNDAAVSVELYDDVAFHRGSGSPKSVLQLHHSVNAERELLDTSSKTWRTLAIWAQEWVRLDADQSRDMMLVTTQHAREGTALAALRRKGRNVDHAAQVLAAIAADSAGSKGTADDRKQFHELGSEQQRAMLARVVVRDDTPGALDLRQQLERLLMGSHETRFIPALADGIEGWWWPRVLLALSDRRPIEAAELRAALDEERRSLSDRALPIRDIDDLEVPAFDANTATFIGCLRAIDTSQGRVDQAVDDFLQAAAHRSYWLRRLLIGPGELARYDRSLLTEWDMRCDRAFGNLSDESSAEELKKSGRTVYDEVQLDLQAPLRAELADRFVQRGTYHTLADDTRLAWHPEAAGPLRDALRQTSAA